MKNSPLANDKKTDYSFVASLIIIILVAFYFGVDFFNRSDLLSYLEKTGNELFAKIINENDREKFETNYAELIKKIENKDISPKKVEQLAANLINLKLAKDDLNEEELKVVFQSALDEAIVVDSLKLMVESVDNQGWIVLNQKVHNIERFEEGMRKNKLSDKPVNGSGIFNYAIDDSLQIILDESIKSDLIISQPSEYSNQIIVLEQERNLKWSKDLKKKLDEQREKVKKDIARLNSSLEEINISTAVSAGSAQSYSFSVNDSNKAIRFKFDFNNELTNNDSFLIITPEPIDVQID